MTVSRLPLAVALSAVALLSLAAANAPGSGNRPSATPDAKERSVLVAGDTRTGIDVKFAEGTDVRLRGNRLVSRSGARIKALDDVLAGFRGSRVSRLFASTSEQKLAARGDLNLYFRIRTPKGADTSALIDALNSLGMVEIAAPQPKPADLPVTPNYVPRQGYRTSAASGGGIDAEYAQTLAGGRGENVTIVDVEYSWNRSHEDLSKARALGAEIRNGTPCEGTHGNDHGTAVLGELSGDPNGIGVTGLAPGATLRTVNSLRLNAAGGCEWNLPSAITVAADNTLPGDVILIEQQWDGPNLATDEDYVPVEWEQTGAIWKAIRDATNRGRIVVEAAGNGDQDLDKPVFNDSTGRNWFSYDSGAIMVGAGNAPGCVYYTDPTIARGRLSFSNYGSRLDVQGWGSCVTTTGYGYLQGGADRNAWYTGAFSGTSSASPIVAASAAILSSVAEARGTTLTPAQVRSILKSTGQAQQFGNSGRIGPLPDLKAAIATLSPTVTVSDAGHIVVEGSTLGASTVPVRQSWASSGSPTQYEVWLSTDGAPYVQQTQTAASAVFDLERNHAYQFVARAKGANGNWSDWASGAKFLLGEYQEDYLATNPAFTGSWTRAVWQPASDGYVTVSATAGDKVSFSFTGTNVAWVATKSTNRGEAYVYVDNAYVKTVDLYSPTTTAQFIAFTKSWTVSGEHRIDVVVRGTAGRPKVDVDAFVRLR
jgi:serine protease